MEAMAGHLKQLLVTIEGVKELAFSQDSEFYREIAGKVVEMRDHFQLEELAFVSSVHDFGVCMTGLHLAVKRVKFIMQRCLDGGWMQAILRIQTNEVELGEILIDLDRYCKQMDNAILKNEKGDFCGEMDQDVSNEQGKYEGFQELRKRREEIARIYFNEAQDRLHKEIDAAQGSGKFGESKFIACILQKLKGGTGNGDLLDVKWAEVVHGSYLGQGAHGCVMESNLFGETLAFKNLTTKSREAEIQASLHHPNIVQVLCCLQTNKGRHMVMELMTTDLRQFLKQKQQGLALSVAIDVILQIARAMYYMHRQGVAHRDLKGANVMVKVPDSVDGYLQVKLGDFGVAKIGLSAKDQNVGTARYRAPEISANPEGIEQDLAKADVYSFALTCYHILTCQEPFTKLGDDDLQKEVVELEKRPQFSDRCPSKLVSLITSCWAADPMKRPDFEMICNDLQHLQLVFTRLSGNSFVTSGPTFLGEGNVDALVKAPDDNLKYGNMPLAALNALKLGIIRDSEEDFEEALKKYNEAYELQPENVCILERRGHAKRKLGRLLEASDDLNEAYKLNPEYGDVLVERGIVKWQRGVCVGALEDLDKFIIFKPRRTFGFYMRGRVKHSMNLFREALVDFDEAHSLGRKDSDIFFHRASTKMALGDYRGAIADFDAISPSRITVDDLCCRATSKAYLGDVQGTLEDYDKALTLSPSDPFILRARASYKLSIFDIKGAFEDSYEASESTYPSVEFQDIVFRGQMRSRSNDFHGTLEELNTVREHEAQNPNFWAFQGFLKSKVDDMQGAMNDVEKANKLKPDDALHLSWQGEIKMVLNDGESAAVDFEKVRELDSGNVDLIWSRATFRSSLGDYCGAVQDVNRILEFDPQNWNAFYFRGEAKRMLNDFEGALADYIVASVLNPGNALVWAQMGYVRSLLQHDYSLALEDFSKAIDIHPLCIVALKHRGILRGLLKDYVGSLEDLTISYKLHPHDIQILTARASAKSCLCDMQGAMQDYDKAVILSPNDPFVLRARANVKLSIFDLKGAMEDSCKASESTYPSVDFSDLIFRGQVRSRSNDFHGTLVELNTVKDRETQNPNFWAFQGFLKSKVDDMQGALNDVEKANELKPDDALYLSWQGQLKLVLKDGRGAAADLQKVRELDSGNVALIWNRATFRSSLGDYSGALRDLNMLLEFDPLNWSALFSRGNAKEMLNDFKGALTDYMEANTMNPNNNRILTAMGAVKGKLNDIVGALAHLNNVDDLQPIHATTYFYRGQMRALMKDYGGSLEDLDIAHRLQPHNTLFLSERAHVKSKREDLDGALADLERAISLEPDNVHLLHGYQGYIFLLKIRFIFVRFLISLIFLAIIFEILILGFYKDPFALPLGALMAWLRSRLGAVMECSLNILHSKFFLSSLNSSLCKVDDTIIYPVIFHKILIGSLIAILMAYLRGYCIGYSRSRRIWTSKMPGKMR